MPQSKSIQVTALREGFRRADRAWHGTTVVPVDRFTPAQLKALRTEPMLEVVTLPDAAQKTGDVTVEAVVDVIAGLDRDKDYTTSGKPEVAAIERVLGVQINAALRDKAWAQFNAAE